MTDKTKAELLAEDWGTVLPFAGFRMDTPQLWEQYGGEWVEYPHDLEDVYDLLQGFRFARELNDAVAETNPQPKPEALALITVGWGAPVQDCDPDNPEAVRPSQSENRKRIALGVFVSRDASACSVLRFELEPDAVTVDKMGTGSLAEALDTAAFYVWGAEYVARLMVNAERNKDEDGAENSPELLRAIPLLGLMAEDAEHDTGAVSDRLEASLRAFLGGEQ